VLGQFRLGKGAADLATLPLPKGVPRMGAESFHHRRLKAQSRAQPVASAVYTMLMDALMWLSMRVSGLCPPQLHRCDLAMTELSTASGRARREMRRQAVLGCLAGGIALAVLPACSDLKPGEDTGTAVFKLNQLPANFACLDKPPAPPPPAPTAPGFSYTGFVPDYRNPLISVKANVRSCSTTDAVCDPGIAQGVPIPSPMPGYPDGFAVGLPASPFQSYIRLVAPDYAPLDYYVKGPMIENVVATVPFSMVSISSLGEFLAGLGADPMTASQLGVLVMVVFDCNSDPAPNVQLKLTTRQPATDVIPWAIQDFIPVAGRPTDERGIAGFVNVPLENVTVEALIDGRSFGSTSFPVLPGRLTGGTLRPAYDKAY